MPDLDILVWPDRENARRILDVLSVFGFEVLGLTPIDSTASGNFIQLGYPPVRAVDLVTSITGVSGKDEDANKENGTNDDVRVFLSAEISW